MSGGVVDRLAFVASACADDPDVGGARAWLKAPLTCDGWLLGTDGHVLLAVAAQEGDPRGQNVNVAGSLPVVLAQLQVQGEPAFRTTVAALREWAGSLVDVCDCGAAGPHEECDECGGVGRTDCECMSCGDSHEAECEACAGTGHLGGGCRKCDGTGVVGRRQLDRVGLIAGLTMNRRNLAWALRSAPDCEVAAYVDRVPTLILVADDWRALVRPLRSESFPGVTDEFRPIARPSSDPSPAGERT